MSTFILDAIKEFYNHNANPSEMGRDLIDGLKEKEEDLTKINEQLIEDTLSDTDLSYQDAEAMVASTIGSQLTKLLIGTASPEDFKVTPPAIEFYLLSDNCSSSNNEWVCNQISSSSGFQSLEILAGMNYKIGTMIYGGSIIYTDFSYEWTTIESPNPLSVSYIEDENNQNKEDWDLITIINFVDPGNYLIEFRITHLTISSLQIYRRLTAIVT